MTQLSNQFIQSVEKGVMDSRFNTGVMSCIVKSDESVALVPGQAVKLADVAGGAPIVTLVTADTDDVFGFVSYNFKKNSFAASESLEIAVLDGNIIYLEASAAIARGASVMYVVTGQKIALATSGKTVLGKALDKASTNGDLVRVYLGLAKEILA